MINEKGGGVTINKRNFVRKSHQLEVDIYNDGVYQGRAITRNLRKDGAFILISDYPGEYYQGDKLDLHFIPAEKNQGPICLSGTVARSSSEGIDVLFTHDQSKFRQYFKTFFRSVGVVDKNERLLKQHLSSHPSHRST